jgi:ATP-dependent RNA helicase RhlE
VHFSELGFNSVELVDCLNSKGFAHATSIQTKAIPVILSGCDVVVGAETGSGKTLSYLLPLIDKCLQYKSNAIVTSNVSSSPPKRFFYPSTVVLVPNKELCNQVFDVADSVCHALQCVHKVNIGLTYACCN